MQTFLCPRLFVVCFSKNIPLKIMNPGRDSVTVPLPICAIPTRGISFFIGQFPQKVEPERQFCPYSASCASSTGMPSSTRNPLPHSVQRNFVKSALNRNSPWQTGQTTVFTSFAGIMSVILSARTRIPTPIPVH